MSRKSQLEGRLLSILQPHVARRVFSGRGVAIACALAVAVIIPVSALRLTAEQPQPAQVAKLSETQQKTSNASVTVTGDVEDDVEAIEDYFLAKLGKYSKHADKFMREPKTGEDWYERAYDLYRNDRYEEAATAFVRASEMNYKRDTALYNAACSWALLGDANRATAMLSRAIDAGWDDFEHIAEDSDFDPIRKDAGFQRLVQRGGTDVALGRMNDAMNRYRALQEGTAGGTKDKKGLDQAIEGGIEGAIHTWVKKHGMDDDTDWHDVGLDLLRLRQFDQAINAFQNAIKTGEKTSTAMYNLACAYSLKGDVKSGMEWLDKSVEYGFSSGEKFENDPDIANLRRQPGFAALVQKAEDLELRGENWGERWHDDDDDRRGRWREAAAHHRLMANKYPQSGRAWFNLGYTALQGRDFATAQSSFQRAIDLGYRAGTAAYNIACSYALQNNTDAAMQWLEKAKQNGFELAHYLFEDEDLESLHDEPRFKALAESVDAKREWKFRWKKSN